MFAKIENGVPVEWTLTVDRLRQRLPGTSIPNVFPIDGLPGGWVNVVATPKPTAGAYATVVEKPPAFNGADWVQVWETVPLTDLESKSAAIITALTAIRGSLAAKIAAGYTNASGKNFQIDDVSQSNMMAVLQANALGVANAHGGYWTSTDNVNVPMTYAEFAAFTQEVFQYKMGLIRNARSLKNAVLSASTAEAIDALPTNVT